MLAESCPDTPRLAVDEIAIYTQSAFNADHEPHSNIRPISTTLVKSRSTCSLKCFMDKTCKMFTFTENTCKLYSVEIDQATFENHLGTKVYYKEN